MHVINFTEDGSMEFVSNPQLQPLTELGTPQKTRVSHVEPANIFLRWCFHAIRSRVADTSCIAQFTRLWPCLWQARLLVAPIVLGPYRHRYKAIEAELQWLRNEGY